MTALDNFSRNSQLNVSGELLNYGTILGFSTNPNVQSGSIYASNIVNEKGATITTQIPSSFINTHALPILDTSLSLQASNSFINSGTISSSGDLSVGSVASGITNNAQGSMTAAGNLNLSAGNGTLHNNGTLASFCQKLCFE